jgi:molecular chaperone GrpE
MLDRRKGLMFNEEEKKVEENEEIDLLEKEEDLQEENNEEEKDDTAEQLEDSMTDLKDANKRLSEENNKINNELEALKDRIARITAEYDNFRKRTAKEKEGIYTDACEDVLKEMLPVLDNLERAISVDGSVEDLKKGIEMTIRQFGNALEKLNVEEVSTEVEFDPHQHNAVMHIDDEQYGANSIVEVFQKGYKRGDKVLRYSMVKVAN